jgi:hypothetical protein
MDDRFEDAAGEQDAAGDDAAGATLPEGFRRFEETMFGYALAVPERFEPLGMTFDPVARSMRALDDATPEREAERLAELPQGFWDPEVAGVGGDGLPRPLRTLEMDCFISDRPLRQDKAALMWFRMRRILPETLAEMALPGYKLLDQFETALGPMGALAVEFSWDGTRAGSGTGDRGLILWGLSVLQVFQLYYHCAAEEWDARLPEFEQILRTFEPLGV